MVAPEDNTPRVADPQYEGNGKSSDDVMEDIRATRSHMDEVIDELLAKVDANRVIGNALDHLKNINANELLKGGSRAGAQVARGFQQNPLPGILIGSGVGFLIYQSLRADHKAEWEEISERHWGYPPVIGEGDEPPGNPTLYDEYGRRAIPLDDESKFHRTSGVTWDDDSISESKTDKAKRKAGEVADDIQGKASEASEAVQDKAHHASAKAKDKSQQAADAIKAKASRAKARVSSRSHQAKGHLQHQANRAQTKAKRAYDRVEGNVRRKAAQAPAAMEKAADTCTRTCRENPLAVGLGVLAAGLFAGLAMPRSRQEDEYVGPYADDLKEDLRQRGAEAVSDATDAALAAFDTAIDEAKNEGLVGEELAKKIHSVRIAAEDQARSEGLDADQLKTKLAHIRDAAEKRARAEGLDAKSIESKAKDIGAKSEESAKAAAQSDETYQPKNIS